MLINLTNPIERRPERRGNSYPPEILTDARKPRKPRSSAPACKVCGKKIRKKVCVQIAYVTPHGCWGSGGKSRTETAERNFTILQFLVQNGTSGKTITS